MDKEREYQVIEHVHQQANVMQALWMMYQDSVLTDVTLSGCDNIAIHCHVSVLAAASPVIKAEALKLEPGSPFGINIVDYSASILKHYIDFAYSGKIAIAPIQIQDLYSLACQLEDTCLKNCLLAQCEVGSQLTTDNACIVTKQSSGDNQGQCMTDDCDTDLKLEPSRGNDEVPVNKDNEKDVCLESPSKSAADVEEDVDSGPPTGIKEEHDESDGADNIPDEFEAITEPPRKKTKLIWRIQQSSNKTKSDGSPKVKREKTEVHKQLRTKRRRVNMPQLKKSNGKNRDTKNPRLSDVAFDKDAWYLANKSAHCCENSCQKIMCEHRRVKITPEELQYSIDHEGSSIELLGECPPESYPHFEENKKYVNNLKTGNQVIEWTGTSEISRKLFPCGFCASYCIGFFNYKRHLGSHFVLKFAKSVRCSQCPSLFKDSTDLRKHIITCHLENNEGGDENQEELTIVESVEDATEILSSTCPICKEEFESDVLQEHVELMHGDTFDCTENVKDASDTKKFKKCKLCKKVLCSHRVQSLSKEEFQHCLDVESYSIQEGDTPDFDMTSFNPAQKETLQKYKGILSMPCKILCDPASACKRHLYPCPHCTIYLLGFRELLYHLQSHDVELPLITCPLCSTEFTNKRAFQRHDVRSHDNKGMLGEPKGTHKCGQCSVVYRTAKALKIHINNHNASLQELKTMAETKFEFTQVLDPKTNRLKKKYVCNLCGEDFAFSRQKSFEKHMAKHDQKGTKNGFRCQLCASTFADMAQLQKHNRLCHGTKMYGLSKVSTLQQVETPSFGEEQTETTLEVDENTGIIKMEVENLTEIKTHEAQNLGPDYFWKCDKCHKVMCGHRIMKLTPAELQYSIEQEGAVIQEAVIPPFDFDNPNMNPAQRETARQYKDILTTPYKMLANAEGGFKKTMYNCPHCDYILLSFNSLLNHLIVHKVKLPEWKCPFCPKVSASPTALKKHDKHMHDNQNKLGQPRGTFLCNTCNVSFYTNEILERHQENHNIDLQEIKTIQETKFKYNRKYDPESKRYVKNFTCDICGLEIRKWQGSFEKHRSSHGLRPYECDKCPSKFGTSQALTNHMREHTGERPFICTECGASFTKSGSLYVHTRSVHAKGQDYKCEVCHKAYKALASLKSHIERVHATFTLPEGETSDYQCTQCGKFVPSEWILRAHMRNHQNAGYPLKCRVCDARFKYHTGRLKHEKTQHGLLPKNANPNIAVNNMKKRVRTPSEPCPEPTEVEEAVTTVMLQPAVVPAGVPTVTAGAGQEVQYLPMEGVQGVSTNAGCSFFVTESGFHYGY